MPKTILVTGGAGYIGSACVLGLLNAGHQVTVFDNYSTGQEDKIPSEAKKIKGDLLDFSSINQACLSNKFDLVIHFAAKKAVGESEVNPTLYFENNVVGSLNLLKAMEQNNIKQIIFSSTAAVYEPPLTKEVINEANSILPENVYGQTKYLVEEMIKTFYRVGKIEQYNIFRYFNVAGDGGLNYKEINPKNVFPIIASKIKDKEVFPIFGTDYDTSDGTCIRDYIHLKDLVDAHLKVVDLNKSGIYNLGTGTGYSVKELVAAFNQQLTEEIKVEENPRRPGDPACLVADPTLATRDLNWQPKHTLSDMVSDTLKVYSL